MKIISLFSGCGGLDLGFERAGFDIIWANDNAKSVLNTYKRNFQNVTFVKKSLTKIDSSEIPDSIVGVIGGPPCQSWSNAGRGKGFDDKRGALFYDFIRVINDKDPMFFVAENVEGLTSKRNSEAFGRINALLSDAGSEGYNVYIKTLNAADYEVPQNRKRVFFVGYRKDIMIKYRFPTVCEKRIVVRDAIGDIESLAIPSIQGSNKTNRDKCFLPNHEYWVGGYSYIFMSRNRVLSWDTPSYTLQASGRQTPIHPQAPKMVKVKKDVMKFVEGKEHLYRRLSIRECARIQTFPDSFVFEYDSLNAGYKMIGNSVPVNLAYHIGRSIASDMEKILVKKKEEKCKVSMVSIQH